MEVDKKNGGWGRIDTPDAFCSVCPLVARYPIFRLRNLGLIPWCTVTIKTGFIVILDYVQEKMYKMKVL